MHENTPVADVVMQLGHIIRVTKIYNEILLPPGTRKANRGEQFHLIGNAWTNILLIMKPAF